MDDQDYRIARHRVHRRLRFYRHLRIYLVINGINLLVNVLQGDFLGWQTMALFWGFFLGIHYFSVFGRKGKFRGDNRRSCKRSGESDRYRYGRPRRRTWRDKDLV